MKEKVMSKLKEYPELEDFFGPCLEKRMERGGWRGNRVLLFLSNLGRDEPPEPLLTQIKKAKSVLENYKDFRPHELRGDEPDFDEKVLDKHAELRALEVLYGNKGYRKGRYIQRQPDRKTPDFEVENKDGQSALVEVKHKRDPFAPATSEALSRGAPAKWGGRLAPEGIVDNFKKILLRTVNEATEQLKEYDRERQKRHIIVICFDLAPESQLVYKVGPTISGGQIFCRWRDEIQRFVKDELHGEIYEYEQSLIIYLEK